MFKIGQTVSMHKWTMETAALWRNVNRQPIHKIRHFVQYMNDICIMYHWSVLLDFAVSSEPSNFRQIDKHSMCICIDIRTHIYKYIYQMAMGLISKIDMYNMRSTDSATAQTNIILFTQPINNFVCELCVSTWLWLW